MGERAACWYRVSTGQQDEKNQYAEVERHCEQRGYEIVRRFELRGDSAYHGRHEAELLQVLADIEAGMYSVLVIVDSSRLDRRDPDRQLAYMLSVRSAGGRVESVREPAFGTRGVGGMVSTVVAQDQNHAYSQKLSQNIRAGHARIDAAGAFRVKAPWGYKITGPKYAKRLAPTPDGCRLVPQVFARIADGESCQAVADWLETETGRRVWPKFVAALIRRPAYYGEAEWTATEVDEHGTVTSVTRTHQVQDPLVDYGLWDRANKRLSVPPKRGRGTRNPALLKGLAACGECGGVMVKKDCHYTRVDGERVDMWYYYCTGSPVAKGARRCGADRTVMTRLDLADRTVHLLMVKLGTEPVTERTLIRGRDWKAELALTERRLRELPRQGLDWAEEDARRAELRALWEDFSGREAEPDRWTEAQTGETFADHWNRFTTDAERGAFLAAQRFRFRLWKDKIEIVQLGASGEKPHRTVMSPLARLPRAGRQAA
jgi:DNA invertase Pin-like site-specific DNA recombinase